MIEIWGNHIGDLRKNKRNSHIYITMASEIQTFKIVVSAEEVNTKLKNLTSRYRFVKFNKTN